MEYAKNYQVEHSKELWEKRKGKPKTPQRYEWERKYSKTEKCKGYQKRYREKSSSRLKMHIYTTTPQYREKQRIKRANKTEVQRMKDRLRDAKERQKPENKIIGSCRARFRFYVIKMETKRYGSFRKMLGADSSTIRKYIESLWTEGMSWSNYGRNGWVVDHVRPLASFDMEDIDQMKQAWHYTNYQPMWAYDNGSKGARYNGINYRGRHIQK
jgi:hypothetical protein